MNPIIVNSISKTYGNVIALRQTSFEVKEGEVFGLIGPDGAGKTSLIRILTSLLLPDSGSATLMNYDVINDYKEIRKNIGYMPGKFSLYSDLSVKENLEFFAGVFGTTIDENYYLIKDIYHILEPFKDRLAGKLSGGMKQKLALSCALIHKPKILILDEPTTGVDAVSRKEFWGILKKLKGEGITILVSTPYMDEASLCDRIALMNKGEILSINTPREIVASYPFKLFSIEAKSPYKLLNHLKTLNGSKGAFLFGQAIHYSTDAHDVKSEVVKQYLIELGYSDTNVFEIEPSIEDCFMQMMNEKE